MNPPPSKGWPRAHPPHRHIWTAIDSDPDSFPNARATVIICDNDQIHHARTVREFIATHPAMHLWCGARYSPHGNPIERVWAVLKHYLANTAVSWPARRRQVHAFFRTRVPGQLLTTAAPGTSSGSRPVTDQLPTGCAASCADLTH